MRFVAFTALVLASGAVVAQIPGGDVAAVVNGQAITLAELDAAVNANLPNVPLTPSQRRRLHAAILEDLIDDVLLRQFLDKSGVKADPAELEAQMKSLTSGLLKENRTLADYLKETGQTETQLREAWALQNRFAAFVKQSATDEVLKAYHAANRDHFDKVEVRASHIVFRLSKASLPAERAASRERLGNLRAEILKGTIDFAGAARKYSQCPTAKSGGDLGFIPRRGLPEDEPLAKAAFALKVGELSEVIETPYGCHLLTVTDRKPGTPSVPEKCVVEVLEAYTDDYRIELLKKLRKEARIRLSLP